MLSLFTLNVGDIMQFRIAKNDFWGKVIDFFTLGGGYSHTAMFVGVGMKAEARAGGLFGMYPISKDDFKMIDVYRVKGGLNAQQVDSLLEKVRLYNGREYDYVGLIPTVMSAIGKMLNLKWLRQRRPYLNDEKKYFCSEIVAKIYMEAIDFDIAPHVGAYVTTPNDVGRSEALERTS